MRRRAFLIAFMLFFLDIGTNARALDVSLANTVFAEWNLDGGWLLIYNGVAARLLLGWDIGSGFSLLAALEPGFDGYGLFRVTLHGGAAFKIVRADVYELDAAALVGAGPSYYIWGNGLHFVLAFEFLLRQRLHLSSSAYCFFETGFSLHGAYEIDVWRWSWDLPITLGIGFLLP